MEKHKIPEFIKEQTACITGNRPKGLPWGYDERKQSCLKFKEEIKTIFTNFIEYRINTFLTGMAEGFDMIGTEILLDLRKTYKHIKIIAVVPCLGQEIKWFENQQKRYRKILSQCDDVIILSNNYYDDCMNDRNHYMVEHSSVCIAGWNGQSGGTSNTIKFAKEKRLKIKIINPNDFI